MGCTDCITMGTCHQPEGHLLALPSACHQADLERLRHGIGNVHLGVWCPSGPMPHLTCIRLGNQLPETERLERLLRTLIWGRCTEQYSWQCQGQLPSPTSPCTTWTLMSAPLRSSSPISCRFPFKVLMCRQAKPGEERDPEAAIIVLYSCSAKEPQSRTRTPLSSA